MPENAKKVTVKLLVALNQADLDGSAAGAAVGDEVEVDADVAERWVAAGIAEAPAPKPAAKKT